MPSIDWRAIKYNCSFFAATRLSLKKRSAAAPAHPFQVSKKRTPLGELTANSSSEWIQDFNCQQKDEPCCASFGSNSVSSESAQNLDVLTDQNRTPNSKAMRRNEDGGIGCCDDSTADLELKKCSSSNSSSLYGHLRTLEMDASQRCLPNYMEVVQTEISPIMRGILVDWLVEVADEYKLVSR